MRLKSINLLLSAALAVLCIAPPVLAAEYPNRPIKMLTMTGPGAQIDLLTRSLAKAMSDQLGQPVLVSNNPGGSHGSVMASELSCRQTRRLYPGRIGNGRVYLFAAFCKNGYKVDDFDYISLLGLNQSGIVCAPNRPWKTLKEAFTWAKKEKKGLTYMFQGSDDRDAMKRIAAKEGVNLALMPSTGGPSIISAVMGGHADLGHLGAILFEYVQSNRLKLLAATTPERLTQLAAVPTLREQGWDESVEMFVVLAAPKGLPNAVMAQLEKVMATLAKDDKFRKFITTDLKMGPVPFGKDQAKAYMKQASERFGREAAEAKKNP